MMNRSGSDDTILIGLAGRAGSGKTTVANYLSGRHGFLAYAFASPIKQALSAMCRLTDEQLEGEAKEETIDWLGRSPRFLMQTLGTEWGRALVHRDIWLLLAERHLAGARERWAGYRRGKPFSMVLSDVRFENEAAWIRERGGIVAHVVRDSGRRSGHASEAGVELIDGDWRIDNSGSLPQLYELVDHMVASITALNFYENAAGSTYG
jgi:Deoxynucleotide monophosphate kinase